MILVICVCVCVYISATENYCSRKKPRLTSFAC